MTASDYVPTNPDLLLASEGASTDAIPEALMIVPGTCRTGREANVRFGAGRADSCHSRGITRQPNQRPAFR